MSDESGIVEHVEEIADEVELHMLERWGDETITVLTLVFRLLSIRYDPNGGQIYRGNPADF